MRLLRTGLLAAAFIAPDAFAARISVTTDARLELVGAAQLLAPEGARPEGFSAPDTPYVRALRKELAGFKGHPAVTINAEPKMLAFKFSDRSQLLLRLSPLPELSERLVVQYSLIDHAGGAENMRRWLDALRDFAKTARFIKLFAREARLIEPAAARFRAKEKKQDYLGTIEAYTGLPLIGTYSVHLSPFQSPGGVANVVADLADGSMEISSVMGPELRDDGIDFWSVRTPGTLWHESAHGVIDGLADIFAESIDRSAAVHAGIGWDCYSTWNQCVKEHFVRAVMIRLMAREISDAAAEEQIAFEKESHYPYMRQILEKLKVYEKERARYPTLADYYPQLLEVFPAYYPRLLTTAPDAGRGQASSPQTLSPSQRARTRRLATAVIERAKEPAVLELARLFSEAKEPETHSQPASPTKPSGPSQMGIEAFRAGRLEEALRAFDDGLKVSPDDREIWMSRGVVLHALSRKEDALASYDRAVALAEAGTGEAQAILPDALTSRATVLLELGQRDRAREDLRRALALAPRDWPQRGVAQNRLDALSGERP